MASSRSEGGGWTPPWAYAGEPHAALTATSNGGRPIISWGSANSSQITDAVAQFLQSCYEGLEETDLSSHVNFLYVVARREPQPGDDCRDLQADTPVAEFGFGAPPASPEEWPLVELRTLLAATVADLRRRSR